MQTTNNDMTNAQTTIQQELQDYKAQPTHSEQIMQIVVVVAMLAGAIWYFSWDVKPFLSQYAQVCYTCLQCDRPCSAAFCS